MKRRAKDRPYIGGIWAAARLINLALEHILCVADGVTVHWEITVRYKRTKESLKASKAVAVATQFTCSSGPMIQDAGEIAQ